MSRPKKAVSSYPTPAQVREATGLTADEKLLLHTVASHEKGVSFGSRETLMRWTGLSERRFRRARLGALTKGVLVETPQPGRATTYRLGRRALSRLAAEGTRTAPRAKRKRQRQRPENAEAHEVIDGTTTLINTPDHSENAEPDRSEQASLDQGGLWKKNKKSNSEDIKNMKTHRKVRAPPRRSQPRTPGVDQETADEKEARLRERIAAYKDRWGGA